MSLKRAKENMELIKQKWNIMISEGKLKNLYLEAR